MKTLIFEPDPGRARGHVALFGDDPDGVDVARSLAEARLLLLNNRYDRLALTRGLGAAKALLGIARATSPDCVMVDLGSMRTRPVSGPRAESDLFSQPA
jgi:hypothetical protein